MGSRQVEQGRLFYNFSLDAHVPILAACETRCFFFFRSGHACTAAGHEGLFQAVGGATNGAV